MASIYEQTEPHSDYEIAQSIDLDPISDVVEPFGLTECDLERYGQHKAKVRTDAVERLRQSSDDADLVLVTGMTPTPKGEGKTVTAVGLGQAFNRIDEDAVITMREPSLGPVFGIKGGAAGGGYSQVLPMEDINLHFTGDIHALTAAHNLIAAMVDSHLSGANECRIDPDRVVWKRAIDMNDRALRDIVVGLGGESGGRTREASFQLTAASELMAILSLADGLADLKRRIGRCIVAYDEEGESVTVDDIEATGAATMLLRDALKPNVVQTVEGTPALVHGGPFANIAHGTNSLLANEAAAGMADWVVTEAGFGSDLGGEKFLNVVCRQSNTTPAAVVLVASVRAIKCHGKEQWPVDTEALEAPDVAAVEAGLANLDRHVENIRQYGLPVVVALNRFPQDTDEEVRAVLEHCESRGIRASESTVFAEGGAGGTDLAEQVIEATEYSEDEFEPLYDEAAPIREKIETIATEVYGAADVAYTGDAETEIDRMTDLGLDDLPVVISKTPYSFSDDPSKKNAPGGWTLDVREVYPSAGAGFLVVLTGDVMELPGLPGRPAAADMDIDEAGDISGLF